MEKSIETQASSVDLAVEKALVELGVSKDKVDVEVISKGGLFSKAKVRVTVKDSIADKMAEFFNGTLYITIAGDDSGVAIGYRGEALDAFQYLALTFLNEQKCDFKKVVVDCENYREKRKETLSALALKIAQKAVRLQRKIALEPMNPFERRIIHSALADSDVADTESEGEEPNRYIVIVPKGVELKDQRPLKNGEREPRKDGKRDRKDLRKGDRRDNRKDARERKPREEEPEAPDGRVYRGYFTEQDDFVKPVAQSGPPKFKSFGGKKKF